MGKPVIKEGHLEFSDRPFFVIDLPLDPNVDIIWPEQLIVKIGTFHIDLGSFCYTQRSSKSRGPGQPRHVVLSSFQYDRTTQVLKIARLFSDLISDGGRRPATVDGFSQDLRSFMDWCDKQGYHDCLSNNAATKAAFGKWAAHVEECLRRHEMKSGTAHGKQVGVLYILEHLTGVDDLSRGTKLVGVGNTSYGMEPAPDDNFKQVLALNQSLFDGICDLVLNNKSFPFKLAMPQFLEWKDNHLWIFPGNVSYLPPHLWNDKRCGMAYGRWAYDYERGRVAKLEEILHRYSGTSSSNIRLTARKAIRVANNNVNAANKDVRHRIRIRLAVIAQSAFFLLFLANTGCNLAVAREIETDEEIEASTVNQSYRAIKFRAQTKMVSVVVPTSFMPSLRRFMELRKYLLNGRSYPYLFLTLGDRKNDSPIKQIPDTVLEKHYDVLRKICPDLPNLGSRKIRATVSDYYRREYDSEVSSRIMAHSQAVADRNYLAGSPADHHAEFTLFLDKIGDAAREQKVVYDEKLLTSMRTLEEGGKCSNFGQPKPISAELSLPDCGRGCLFCSNRILIANEEDARKVASAAFMMEQLIFGPLSEAEFRPSIIKCENDLEKIASMEGCELMVRYVKRDVFENGNLTPYFSDKYQMFLELGVL